MTEEKGSISTHGSSIVVFEDIETDREMISSVFEAAIICLNTADVERKAHLTLRYCQHFQKQKKKLKTKSSMTFDPNDKLKFAKEVPCKPVRNTTKFMELENQLDRSKMKKLINKFSKSIEFSIHGVCHAEGYAIDLMWDIIVRTFQPADLVQNQHFNIENIVREDTKSRFYNLVNAGLVLPWKFYFTFQNMHACDRAFPL